jgi:hypothetical protein
MLRGCIPRLPQHDGILPLKLTIPFLSCDDHSVNYLEFQTAIQRQSLRTSLQMHGQAQ